MAAARRRRRRRQHLLNYREIGKWKATFDEWNAITIVASRCIGSGSGCCRNIAQSNKKKNHLHLYSNGQRNFIEGCFAEVKRLGDGGFCIWRITASVKSTIQTIQHILCARNHQSATQRRMKWNGLKRECPETSNTKAMKVLIAIADDNRIKFRIVMRNVPEIGFRFTHTHTQQKRDHMIMFQAERRKNGRKV